MWRRDPAGGGISGGRDGLPGDPGGAVPPRRAERAERLDAFLEREDLESVWFADPDTFAWATGGSNLVDRRAAVGEAAVGFDGAWTVVTDGIEADRLREEELPEGTPVESYEWHAGSLAEAVAERAARPAGADFDVPGFARVDASPLRTRLADGDVVRYRYLGADAAAAVEAACRAAEPTDTERDVAARVETELAERGAESPVVLVGGAERARRYRHFTPTEAVLGDYALVSVTARRRGLYASATRTVAFDPPPWLLGRHESAATVEATALAATRAHAQRDGTAGDVFGAIRDAYAALGHRGEWREHHQGGATGYAGREWFAAPGSEAPLALPAAYAWNPTVRGTKSEGTALVTADGVSSLTAGDWPTVEVSAVGFEATFERPAVLVR
ncbi:MAG: M24 family metallopeptidase [Haloarculaceae archaeon]